MHVSLLIVGFRVPMPGCYFETLGLKADFVFCGEPALCVRTPIKHVLSIRVIVIIILLDKEHTKNKPGVALKFFRRYKRSD